MVYGVNSGTTKVDQLFLLINFTTKLINFVTKTFLITKLSLSLSLSLSKHKVES